MEIPDDLLCVFSAQIEERNGSYFVDIPEREVTRSTLQSGEIYRVGVLLSAIEGEAEHKHEAERAQERNRSPPEPPVDEGERRKVEIEDIGEQGDGIARVERGYVIIVPDTEKGERVTIEVTQVQQNVAFAEVVERLSYYD